MQVQRILRSTYAAASPSEAAFSASQATSSGSFMHVAHTRCFVSASPASADRGVSGLRTISAGGRTERAELQDPQ